MYHNQVTIVLTLGKDAQSKQVGERNVINFNGASTRKWRDQSGQDKEKTDWFEVQLWCKTTGLLQYLTKGQSVLVTGSLATREWEKDGQKHYATYIEADSVQLFPKREKEKSDAPF